MNSAAEVPKTCLQFLSLKEFAEQFRRDISNRVSSRGGAVSVAGVEMMGDRPPDHGDPTKEGLGQGGLPRSIGAHNGPLFVCFYLPGDILKIECIIEPDRDLIQRYEGLAFQCLASPANGMG